MHVSIHEIGVHNCSGLRLLIFSVNVLKLNLIIIGPIVASRDVPRRDLYMNRESLHYEYIFIICVTQFKAARVKVSGTYKSSASVN